MEDLLQLQIRDSCKLALPEGLGDLMSDISREVLRFQPRDLYQFITDYLSALLVTRENLSVAAYICRDIYECGCEPELQHELEDIGLNNEDVKTAKDIILKYIEKGPVHEGTLLMRLVEKTSIDADMMPAVQDAIRAAYLRHQAHNTTVHESSSDSDQDEMMSAAKHTINLYEKTKPSPETCNIMATKIQAAYRAYGVKRHCVPKYHMPQLKYTKSTDRTVTLVDPKISAIKSSPYDIDFPKTKHSEDRMSDTSWSADTEMAISSSMNQNRVTTMSSTCLAGSFLLLPTHKPYSAHECEILSNLEEIPEREFAYLDYTAENPHISMVSEDKLYLKNENNKKISFSDSVPDATKRMGLEVDDDSESRDDDVDQKESSMDAIRGSFYRSDDINDKNYDGDVEIDQFNDFDEPDDD